MPEYLAPGVYVEEVSFRSKSIEGVSTTTTGFIGASRFGPVDMLPDIVTSLGEYERVYGDGQQLSYSDVGKQDNFLWHAVRGFFEEGGKRLYISRVFKAKAGDTALGKASTKLPTGAGADNTKVTITARFPGSGGNVRVMFTLNIGQNILTGTNTDPIFNGGTHLDMVWVGKANKGKLHFLEYNDATQKFSAKVFGGAAVALVPGTDEVRLVTLTVTVTGLDGSQQVFAGLAPVAGHTRGGEPDSLDAYFSATPANSGLARTLPIVLAVGSTLDDGYKVVKALIPEATVQSNTDIPLNVTLSFDSADTLLAGGNDGDRPGATEYEGTADDATAIKTGLKAFEDLEDISIVAAPGSTFGYEGSYKTNAVSIANLLISHASRMRYRIAVLDSGNAQSISQVRAMRAQFDSKYAALYYPWVRILDPITRKEIFLPPSGFVSGIYARNDIERGVHKAPANEVANLALGFENNVNKSQQDVLNPEGINCFRYFEGRGNRLWGARTISSDPEWKYVNLRRYFAYVERSIDIGTQWAVFEPNGDQLWANVRRTIYDFLLNEWQKGSLLGEKPEKAFFVRCDRSTMTQNDLDNGRLVCLIGIAPLRPAEFVIFKIGQWTADHKV
ncbi:MAG: phage tail protein [Chloroflexi bacterium HGW-Chloroflexi-6]|nr:MAG: phage tail protein [Chloroflexi bacterium HGW-Chloroflexi-6]